MTTKTKAKSKAKKSEQTRWLAEECDCLKCHLKDAIVRYYQSQQKSSPDEIAMSSDEIVGSAGAIIAELLTTIPDKSGRLVAVSNIASAMLHQAELARPATGEVPTAANLREVRGRGQAVH